MPSYLPEELFTHEEGSNGGLDTFPDIHGSGVLYQFPETVQSGLPEGFDPEFADMGDISHVAGENAVTDLSWLEIVEPHPERLPHETKDTVIPELQDLWFQRPGGNSSLHLNPNVDRDVANYRKTLASDVQAPKKLTASQMSLVQSAWRKITAGHPLKATLTEMASLIQPEYYPLLKAYASQMRDDYGLIGRVFLRASLYDQCASGKHKEAVTKEAKYIVAKKACSDCVFNRQGSCAMFNKKLVTEVPWQEALTAYNPLLEATGRQASNTGDAKEALRKALRTTVKGMDNQTQTLPTHHLPTVTAEDAHQQLSEVKSAGAITPEMLNYILIQRKAAKIIDQVQKNSLQGKALVATIIRTFTPADMRVAVEILDPHVRQHLADKKLSTDYSGIQNKANHTASVTASEAWDQLNRNHPPEPIVRDMKAIAKAEERLAANETIQELVRVGVLSAKRAGELINSDKEARDILRLAVAESAGKVTAYSGTPNSRFELGKQEAQKVLKAAQEQVQRDNEQMAKEAQERTHRQSREYKAEQDYQERLATVKQAIERGITGNPLRNLVVKNIRKEEYQKAAFVLDPLIRNQQAQGTRVYAGTEVAHTPTRQASEANPLEVRRLLRWAKQKLTEGTAGQLFDTLLGHRFAQEIKDAAKSALADLRQAHEGLSGFVYVDASAYATPNGVQGCEKGAMKHRANAIPTVLAISACDTCVFKQAKADGTGVCQVYNKRLVSSVPVEHPKEYQREQIRLANGGDAERVASLFAPQYTNDFQLGKDSELDNLVVSDTPEIEKLGEVLFGGMYYEP